MPPANVLSATRLHFPVNTTAIPEATVQHLKNYARSTKELGIAAAVAVNNLEAEVQAIILEEVPEVSVKVLHVPVWGAFVPALNTLLGEAQHRGVRYILYQSLEVRCAPLVLKKLLDHFTPDTLVVGPVLEGHVFEAGEQPLNGRTTPWNTLALWSTRKLGLTGFLSIADGMPEAARRISRQLTGESTEAIRQQSGESAGVEELDSPAMGSVDWWERRHIGAGGFTRQMSEQGTIPAGVEEVTVIALLQHLLGDSRARAVLLQLPPELDSLVSWKTNWGGDERRKQWHEYKMASKVTRPAAQIKQLFGKRRNWGFGLQAALLPRVSPVSEVQQVSSEEQDPQLRFGVVWHLGESIRPPLQVELICLASVALFSANFASAFAAAFQSFNADRAVHAQASLPVVTFVSLLIGGVYLPMPLSLFLTRLVTSRADHISGLALSAAFLVVSHAAIVLWEARGLTGYLQQEFVLATRFLQGMASGVLFQARFILASMSTQEHHQDLQARLFFANDLGLGVGALLPWVAATTLAGRNELSTSSPELFSSAILACISLALLSWILVAFPRRVHRLPDKVRFPPKAADAEAQQTGPRSETWQNMVVLWISGTTRVFVQSAAMITLALWMRDAGLTGSFRQTKAVAALCLLPAPFEALASGICCPPWVPKPQERVREVAIGTVGVVVIVFACTSWIGWVDGNSQEGRTVLAAIELAVLLVALAFAAPLHVSRLYELKNAERALVTLEWLKAYIGRLLGPIAALAVQNWLGYGPLLAMLCVATVVVAITA